MMNLKFKQWILAGIVRHRLVTSRNLRSRTGTLFPLWLAWTRPPWRLCGGLLRESSYPQSEWLRLSGKCLELEPTFKILWGHWLFLQHYYNKVSSLCSILTARSIVTGCVDFPEGICSGRSAVAFPAFGRSWKPRLSLVCLALPLLLEWCNKLKSDCK